LGTLVTPEGMRLPPLTLAEMLRDIARLRLLREQIRTIEKARVQRLKAAPVTHKQGHRVRAIRGRGWEAVGTATTLSATNRLFNTYVPVDVATVRRPIPGATSPPKRTDS
jgi:hypothetical protein